MAQESGIVLKFFSGPHLGAELPLLPGSTVLGSGNGCDIITEDSTVLNRHFVIRAPDTPGAPPRKEAELFIEPLDGPVFFMRPVEADADGPKADGAEPAAGTEGGEAGGDAEDAPEQENERREKITEKTLWPPLVPLMAGTTCMAWKREEDGWGDLFGGNLFPGEPFAENRDEDEDPGASKKKKPEIVVGKWTGRLVKVFSILILFAFIFGPCMGGVSTRDARDMKRLLRKNDFRALMVQQIDLGVVISGKVKTREQRKQLWRLAGGAEYPVYIDVVVEEERAYAVKVALSVRGLFPEVDIHERHISMKGYMRDKLIEGAAKVWLGQDIPDIGELKSDMVYAGQVWPVLKNSLIFHKLADRVLIRFHPGLVQVEGELDFDRRITLETVKKEVRDSLNAPVAFWDTLTAPGFSPEWNKSLNAGAKSAYGPDPALARLFLDARSAKGLPAFSAAAPALEPTGKIATTTAGRPVRSVGPLALKASHRIDMERLKKKIEQGKKRSISQHHDIAVLEPESGREADTVAVLLDKEGNIVKGPDGEPILLPPARDRDGTPVRDREGNMVFARPLTDRDGKIVFTPPPVDPDGNILPTGTNGVLTKPVADKNGKVTFDVNDVRSQPPAPVLTGPVTDGRGRVIHDRRGKPVMGRTALDENGKVIRDARGNPVVLGVALDEEGRALRDKDKDPVPLVVARDAGGRVARDKEGNPVVVPALLDRKGNVVRDKKGRPVSPAVVTDRDGKVVVDANGNIILDEEATNALLQKYAPEKMGPGEPVTDGRGRVIHDSRGKPVTGRTARDEKGNIIRDSRGNPVVLGVALDEKGRALQDKNGDPVPLVVARDTRGRVVRDKKGNPVVVPALLDENGNVVRDKKGRPVSPAVKTDSDGRVVRDAKGNIILDDEATGALRQKHAAEKTGQARKGEISSGSGTPLAKETGNTGTGKKTPKTSKRLEDPLGGLKIEGITMTPIPFVSMTNGQKYFTGGKLPTGYVITKIKTKSLTLVRKNKKRIYRLREE